MKPQAFKCLGLTANIEVPATTEEFDTNAKRTGACLDEAINNVVYRGVLANLRDVFLHGDEEEKDGKKTLVFEGLEHRTKNARKTKVLRKNAEGEEIVGYAETEADYFQRVLAETKQEASAFQSLMDAAVKRCRFDASEAERKPRGPIKIGENWLKAADSLIAGNDFTKFEKSYHKFTGKALAHPTVDEGKTDEEKTKAKELRRNLYARLIKEMYDAKVAKELASGVL